VYRALEAHTVTLLALYDLYIQSFLSTEPEKRAYLQESSLHLREAYQKDINRNTEAERNLREILQNTLTIVGKWAHFQHKGLCFHLAGKRTFRTPPEDDSTPNPNFRAEYEIYNPNG